MCGGKAILKGQNIKYLFIIDSNNLYEIINGIKSLKYFTYKKITILIRNISLVDNYGGQFNKLIKLCRYKHIDILINYYYTQKYLLYCGNHHNSKMIKNKILVNQNKNQIIKRSVSIHNIQELILFAKNEKINIGIIGHIYNTPSHYGIAGMGKLKLYVMLNYIKSYHLKNKEIYVLGGLYIKNSTSIINGLENNYIKGLATMRNINNFI